MRETEHCALKLTIFYLGTNFRGLLLTSSGADEVNFLESQKDKIEMTNYN